MPICSLSKFTDAYITGALWSSSNDAGDPLFSYLDRSDIHENTLAVMLKDCRDFFFDNEADILCDGGPTGLYGSSQVEMAGHDFWLTRCGHGAGFWDGDWPEQAGERLTRASEKYGNVDLYVCLDGKVHAF